MTGADTPRLGQPFGPSTYLALEVGHTMQAVSGIAFDDDICTKFPRYLVRAVRPPLDEGTRKTC